jgi:2-keto-3-deoxy-L-fuconate dehydrogenase
MARSLPIQRLGGAEEVAYLASFLVSDRSKFITGSVQMIDGGQTAA